MKRIGSILAALLVLTATCATTATAAPLTFGSGQLDWGVKASFRSYVTGPIAHGSYTAFDGASKDSEPAGILHFPVLGGSYDDDTGVGEIIVGGGVHFLGHDGDLDMTFSNLCVGFEGGAGKLYGDVVSKDRTSGTTEHFVGIALVDMATVPAPVLDGSGATWSSIATTLNAAAVPVFGQYSAGEGFDPIEPLEATFGAPQPRPGGGPCRTPAPPDGGGGGGGGSGGGGGGSSIDVPAPPVKRPAWTVAKKVLTVGGKPVTLATLRCGSRRCGVTVPKSVKVKIKRKRYSVAVLAPKALKPGAAAKLRVKLPKAARRALAGRRATVKVRVVVTADGRKTTKTIKRTVKANG